jgi:cobalt/nickel transport system permease protein
MSAGASAAAIFAEDRDSGPLAQVDPRVRIAAALSFLALLAVLHSGLALAAALASSIAVSLYARLPFRPTLRRMTAVEGFLVFLLVTLPLTVPGPALFSLFGLSVSAEGVRRAVGIIVRVNAGVLMAAALLSTMGTMRLAGAMNGIGLPDRVAHLFQLTARYIAVFQEEYTRLRRAMRARGFRAGSNSHSWRSLGHLLGMLVVRSAERAERVAWAMRARGFNGRFPAFEQQRLGRTDFRVIALWPLFLIALLVLEFA